MTTLLLAGLPRSGTTLACALLNRMPNVLALAEPMLLQDLRDRSAALEMITDFIRVTRERALRDGHAPTLGEAWTADNLAEPPRADGGLRAGVGQVRSLPIGKPLSPEFLLFLKHPALFTALAQDLEPRFPVFATVRSPLAALASWQTLEFLPHQGRSVIAERMDSDLAARLDRIPDRLDRQVELMGWYFSAFAKMPERRVVRYEDLVRHPASQLSLIMPSQRRKLDLIDHPLRDVPPEDRYPEVDLPELARRLERLLPVIEPFYPGYRETLAETIDGGRVRLRRKGVDGRGRARIDFFVAGVQKGGTTAAAAYLSGHPAVRMSNRKEVHFFDRDDQDWSAPDYEKYHAWFQPPVASAQAVGEATPIYLYWPKAMKRLQAYNPDAKLIVLLRHPSFRAHSQWRMEIANGRETLDFSLAIRPEGRCRVGTTPNGAHRVHSYVDRSLYGPQIGRLLTLFPRRQCCFFRTDELWSSPDAVLQDIQRLIGVEAIGLGGRPPIASVHRPQASMLEEDRSFLDSVFRDDIQRTQDLTGLDLGDWLRPDYREPMTEVETRLAAVQ